MLELEKCWNPSLTKHSVALGKDEVQGCHVCNLARDGEAAQAPAGWLLMDLEKAYDKVDGKQRSEHIVEQQVPLM